jgi:hypothetical protein
MAKLMSKRQCRLVLPYDYRELSIWMIFCNFLLCERLLLIGAEGSRIMSAEQYRRYAGECLRLLASTVDPQNRTALQTMAIAWTNLAEQAEKNAARPEPGKSPKNGLSQGRSV